jgi:predicted ATPase
LSAPRFTHVKLENWRNFTLVDVPLQPRAFMVGANASGKSNLLDAFRFLHDIVSVGGGFQEAVRKRGGVSRIRCLAARQYPDIAISVRLGNDDALAAIAYELRFKQDKNRRVFIERERVVKDGVQVLSRPSSEDKDDPERLTQTYLEQVNVNKEFREVADFLRSVRYFHVVPQIVRDPSLHTPGAGRASGQQDDPYGRDFLEQIAKKQEKTRNSRLRRILEALRVAVPQIKELELTRDERGTPHLRGRYEHWRPQGAWQTEEDFSDGTLRLMGLLWAALDGKGPILLEEPELSIHPEVCRVIPQMFARMQRRTGRQVLISTHSSDLLHDEGIGLDEVLLLKPGAEGTTVKMASEFADVRDILEGGYTMAEAVIPHTRPNRVEQLTLFGDM